MVLYFKMFLLLNEYIFVYGCFFLVDIMVVRYVGVVFGGFLGGVLVMLLVLYFVYRY